MIAHVTSRKESALRINTLRILCRDLTPIATLSSTPSSPPRTRYHDSQHRSFPCFGLGATREPISHPLVSRVAFAYRYRARTIALSTTITPRHGPHNRFRMSHPFDSLRAFSDSSTAARWLHAHIGCPIPHHLPPHPEPPHTSRAAAPATKPPYQCHRAAGAGTGTSHESSARGAF